MGILSALSGGLIGQVGSLIDNLHTSQEEKEEAKIKMEELLQKRDAEIEETIRTELQAKERVKVAEMNQSDNFTKRARPGVVWVGLGMMCVNFTVIPLIESLSGTALSVKNFPEEFWWAWSGVVATWSIGRSMERRGVSSNAGRQAVSAITGSKVI